MFLQVYKKSICNGIFKIVNTRKSVHLKKRKNIIHIKLNKRKIVSIR